MKLRPLLPLLTGLSFALAGSGCDDDVVCEGDACEGGASTTGGGSALGGGGSAELGGGGAGGAGASGGAGGEGGSPEWTLPSCESVSGTAGVAIAQEGSLLPPSAAPPNGTRYTFGITTSDRPNELFSDFGGTLLHSEDAGCSWTEVGATGGSGAVLVAAPGGAVIGWTDNGSAMLRADALEVTSLVAPTDVIGLGIDQETAAVRLVGSDGSIWRSSDDGEGWELEAQPAMFQGQLIYRAAFDPADLDHFLVGMAVGGAWVTHDGGASWTQATGLSTGNANAFSIVISPVDPAVVWIQGLDLSDDARHLYRSSDGGETFDAVVTESEAVVMTNGVPLFAHPRDPNVALFEFGTYYANYGTDLYRYDHGSGDVTTRHFDYDEVKALAFSPVDPDVIYLGLSYENVQ